MTPIIIKDSANVKKRRFMQPFIEELENNQGVQEEQEAGSFEKEVIPIFRADKNGNVKLRPNGTIISGKFLKDIKWSLSGTAVTRKIIVELFGRETLATHNLSGRPSPAFLTERMPIKGQLDPKKVQDVIQLVMQCKQIAEKEVKSAIVTKCADESKWLRETRMARLQNFAEN